MSKFVILNDTESPQSVSYKLKSLGTAEIVQDTKSIKLANSCSIKKTLYSSFCFSKSFMGHLYMKI